MKQTIFEHLTEEHVEFRKMMATLAEQYDEKLFGEFGDELERHQEAEEQTLYAVLRDDPSTRELVLEGIEEHNAATALLRKLQQQNGGTDTWMAKMTVLREQVQHHLEHEETELFDKARNIISDDEAMTLTEEFESKKEAVSTPV